MTTRRLVKSAVLLILAVALIVVISGLNGSSLTALLTAPGTGGRVLLAVVLILVGAAVWRWL